MHEIISVGGKHHALDLVNCRGIFLERRWLQTSYLISFSGCSTFISLVATYVSC